MKTTMKTLFLILVCVSLLGTPAMAKDKPGEGVTLKPGRATWNTGLFPGSIGKQGA